MPFLWESLTRTVRYKMLLVLAYVISVLYLYFYYFSDNI
jgi:hypothetical protein